MDVQVINSRKGQTKYTVGKDTDFAKDLVIPADFVVQYNSQQYVVKAGKSRWIPEEALSPQLGYIGAINTPKHKRRDEEVTRLRVMYGVYDDDQAWEEFLSKFGIEVLDHDGEHVATPLTDPDGAAIRVVDDMDERERLESMLAQMQRRLDQLEAQNAGPAAVPDEPNVPATQLAQPTVVSNEKLKSVDDEGEVSEDDIDAHLDFQPPEDTPSIPSVDN